MNRFSNYEAAMATPKPDLRHASLWYYIDDSGTTQGPFASNALRGWFQAQFLPGTTRVAPSWYGEVPVEEEFAPIFALWPDSTQVD